MIVNLNFNGVEWQITMVVVTTEVISKWQQYGNKFVAVFSLSPLLSKMFYNLYSKNPVAGSWNQSYIKRDVIWTKCCVNMSAHQEAGKWISWDWSSLGKRVIKWVSFNKTDVSCENNLSEAINKSSHLKVISQHFLSKIEKKTPQKKFIFHKIAVPLIKNFFAVTFHWKINKNHG